MRRALPLAALLAALLMVVTGSAAAITVVPPGDGQVLKVGDQVTFSGTEKAAGTRIRIWDGGSYTGCFPQPALEESGSWSCDVSGPWRPGTYDYEVRVFDDAGNQVGDSTPTPFTFVSVLRVDPGSLKFTTAQPIRITGSADTSTTLSGVVTRQGDRSFRLPLACAFTGRGDGFACVEPSSRAAGRAVRPAAIPAANDYLLTLTEDDVEIGLITQLVQEFSVVVATNPPPNVPDPEPVPTPTAAPPAPGPSPTPSAGPTSTPTSTATPTTPTVTPTGAPAPTPVATLPRAIALPPVSAPPLVVAPPSLPAPDLSLLIGLLIAAFTTLAIAGGRAFSGLRLVGAVPAAVPGAAGGAVLPVVTDASGDDNDLDRETAHRTELGWGDRSVTWRLPGHLVADRIGLLQPRRIAPWSPLVGRLLADAGYLRSMLGIAWLVPLIGAAVVAAIGLGQVAGRPLPPSTAVVVVVIVLACLDALAGALAVTVFWLGVLVSGGLADGRLPDLAGSIAVLLVLGLLWMALPLIGSATRPFRRRSGATTEPGRSYTWDRVADGFVAAALCGWVAAKLTQALAPFAGLDLAIGDHALAVGIATAGGVVLRLVLEEVAEHGYPQRLRQVEVPGSLPDPSRATQVGGALLRTAALGVLAYVFLGACWQLWVGLSLVGVWQVASAFDDQLPKSPRLGQVLPRGITKILVMMLVCTVVAAWATSGRVGLDQVRDCFVIMAVPSSVLAGVSLFAESPPPARWTWTRQLAGAGVYVAIVVLVLTGW